MKKQLSKTEYVLTSIILFVIDFIITGYAGIYLWNNIIAVVFNVMTLSFWQCWAVSLCLTYFIPRLNENIDDYAEYLLKDIIGTLFIWFIAFLIVSNISF